MALVFIHGWSCDQTFWSEQVPAFAGEHTVVTIDLAGHGKSGTNREAWTVGSLPADVVAVVEHLGLEKVILIGHSMGGPVALGAAALLPGKVVGVVGVDTLHNADFKWNPEQFAGWLAAWDEDFAGTCKQFVHSMFVAGEDPQIADATENAMCDADPSIAVSLMRDFPNADFPALFRGAGAPIRLLNAPAVPTNVEGNRQYAPDFDAVVMEGVGYFPMLTRPEEFNHKLAEMVAGLLTGGGQG
ncbi:MAG: alpha/beta hydrolase [Thermoanaerobaculia bacterium]|nr:alpha/beta hydrolase [Thermoanaerobaculia bacterium]